MIIGKNQIFALNTDNMTFKEAVIEYAEEPLPRQIMMDLLKEYKRPNDKINELVKRGELITVKKGLYVAGPGVTVTKT
jgi:hypothetical protein